MSQQLEAEAEMDQESDDENDMKQQVEAELDDEEDEIEKDRSAKKDKVRRRNVKRFVDVHYRQHRKGRYPRGSAAKRRADPSRRKPPAAVVPEKRWTATTYNPVERMEGSTGTLHRRLAIAFAAVGCISPC